MLRRIRVGDGGNCTAGIAETSQASVHDMLSSQGSGRVKERLEQPSLVTEDDPRMTYEEGQISRKEGTFKD